MIMAPWYKEKDAQRFIAIIIIIIMMIMGPYAIFICYLTSFLLSLLSLLLSPSSLYCLIVE
jgi:hypothetical protein